MARIEFDHIAHSYYPNPRQPSDYALKEIDTTWEDGGAYALLGPSGCGKTTLLNVISGLLKPSKGRVLYDGVDVTDLPPEKRNIAQVFQFPVLYDTMSVFENLAFPLKNRRFNKTDTDLRVREVAEMLDLTDVLNKKAAGLSADAKQKISLGRGLVRSDVAAVLFDEPLTVIDPHLKWHLRRKLKEIHEQLKLTLIYVTHDQVEALTFADQVILMNNGEIYQIGTPQELFENPKHKFVGYFIGSPGMNFLTCTLEGQNARVDGATIALDPATAARGAEAGGVLELGIRPMHLQVYAEAVEGGIPVALKSVDDQGSFKILTAAFNGHTLRARIPEGHPVPENKAWLKFPPERTKLFADERLVK
ncbi:ABC transporter ATP-binding protein [Desulfosarcina widdelii]|uniref:ABC transporter ATP-binding protein n=1 Tax=Desulfosarcina widdelii TaxID=947919 RepID=A0A5K7ZE66_9BACT|nr:ABC transporter ATP-binding protein [Desulfosarcina widdelii]BBO76714.1 ABC transporter ATP-binding protein [Desulfosarcina widdelii]